MVAAFSAVALAQDNNGGAPQVPAPAQTATMPAEIPKPCTVTLGVDFPTAYLFRGIYQESAGMIAHAPIDVGVALGKGVSLNVGQWYSMHSGPTGKFYEADHYGSLTFSTGKFNPGVLFTSYTSPNDQFATVHELAAFVSFDDSASRFPLAPKATVAFELDGQADGGASQGTYLELAIRPSMTVIDAAKPLTLAVPVRLGMSLKDYYEGPNGSDTFGFFSTGLIASVPITTGKVVWDVHGGVDVSWLGTNTKFLNGNDAVKPIGVFGITITY